jgi:hypothetical protein
LVPWRRKLFSAVNLFLRLKTGVFGTDTTEGSPRRGYRAGELPRAGDLWNGFPDDDYRHSIVGGKSRRYFALG